MVIASTLVPGVAGVIENIVGGVGIVLAVLLGVAIPQFLFEDVFGMPEARAYGLSALVYGIGAVFFYENPLWEILGVYVIKQFTGLTVQRPFLYATVLLTVAYGLAALGEAMESQTDGRHPEQDESRVPDSRLDDDGVSAGTDADDGSGSTCGREFDRPVDRGADGSESLDDGFDRVNMSPSFLKNSAQRTSEYLDLGASVPEEFEDSRGETEGDGDVASGETNDAREGGERETDDTGDGGVDRI